MQINAIFFDPDATLVDGNDRPVLAREEAFAGIGETFDRQVIHDQIGQGADMLAPTFSPHLDNAAHARAAALYDDVAVLLVGYATSPLGR